GHGHGEKHVSSPHDLHVGMEALPKGVGVAVGTAEVTRTHDDEVCRGIVRLQIVVELIDDIGMLGGVAVVDVVPEEREAPHAEPAHVFDLGAEAAELCAVAKVVALARAYAPNEVDEKSIGLVRGHLDRLRGTIGWVWITPVVTCEEIVLGAVDV